MGSILNESERNAIYSRMESLSASSNRRWGKMSVTEMLEHLRLSAEMAAGDLPVASANKRIFQVFPLKHLILYVVPFPKGAPTAPDLYPKDAGSFEDERAALRQLMDRIATGAQTGMGPAHPLFGTLSWREWGVLIHKHTDHHLKQFGA